MAARKNLHAKPLKGCVQATQVRGNSANARISIDTTVKLSITREQSKSQLAIYNYRWIEKEEKKKNQIFNRSL